jgi:hypothetical protein
MPNDIADVVARINSLPEPSIACLVASLPRPLSLVASLGVTSLQPAANSNAPRIFIMLDKLTLSVVAAGDTANRVELGEWVTPQRTLKGELRFPVSLPVASDEPYEGLVDVGQQVSSCGFCHRSEEAHPTIAGAFVSDALQPAQLNELSLADLHMIHAECKVSDGPHCWLLRALFDYGEVRQGAFASEVRRGF